MISNGGIDAVVKSGKGPKNWWQFTTGGEFRTENSMLNFVERVEDSGASAISFTVDIMHVSHLERSIHNKFVRTWCNTGVPRDAQGNLIYKEGDEPWRTGGFPSRPFPTPTWETVKKLRDLTDLPIVIKGILTAEDTEMAVRTGMSGVIVSSHGADVLKALALGATAVGVARPYLWGLTTFGQQGVARVIELLRTELALDMGMSGVASIADIDRKLVRIRNYTL